MGPIEVTLHSAVAVEGFSWLRRRPKDIGLLNLLPSFPAYPGQYDDKAGPFAGGLPKKAHVGEQFIAYLVPDHESLASDKIVRIGFYDTFNRYHWAPKRELVRARQSIREACDMPAKNSNRHRWRTPTHARRFAAYFSDNASPLKSRLTIRPFRHRASPRQIPSRALQPRPAHPAVEAKSQGAGALTSN
jgi:hypothetical protein